MDSGRDPAATYQMGWSRTHEINGIDVRHAADVSALLKLDASTADMPAPADSRGDDGIGNAGGGGKRVVRCAVTDVRHQLPCSFWKRGLFYFYFISISEASHCLPPRPDAKAMRHARGAGGMSQLWLLGGVGSFCVICIPGRRWCGGHGMRIAATSRQYVGFWW